jgi:hypothetical protein
MLARAQAGSAVLFDCRDPTYKVSAEFRKIASLWLDKVVRFDGRR